MTTLWCGIDPGLANVGIALLTREEGRWRYRYANTITTKPKTDLGLRLFAIYQGLTGALHGARHMVGIDRLRIAIESQEGARVGARRDGESNYGDDRVERVVGIAWTIAVDAANHEVFAEERVLPLEPTPGFIRQVLGLRRDATKKQIARMVQALVRELPEGLSSHAYDACATAIAGERIASRGRP